MEITELKNQFNQEIYPSHINEWELDELIESIIELSDGKQRELLSYVHVIWPVSHSLCFSFIELVPTYLHHHTYSSLAEWVRQLLGNYEKGGLRAARLFMSESVSSDGVADRRSSEVRLEDVRGKLTAFIRGVSGRQFEINTADYSWTDTTTIFLPEALNAFPTVEENRRFYTYLACCQWGYVRLGSLIINDNGTVANTSQNFPSMEGYLGSFPDQSLAFDLYHFVEYSSVYSLLSQELPGLMREIRKMLLSYVSLNFKETSIEQRFFYEHLLTLFSKDADQDTSKGRLVGKDHVAQLKGLRIIETLYEKFSGLRVDDWSRFELVTGKLRFDKVRERLARKRLEEKQIVIDQLAMVVQHAAAKKKESESGGNSVGGNSASAIPPVVDISQGDDGNRLDYLLTVDSDAVTLPQDLKELLSNIEKDLGHIPESYVQAAAGIAGQGRGVSNTEPKGNSSLHFAEENSLYDEWDYRRKGYRKNWCAVIEKDILPVRSNFVEHTIEKYRGVLTKLRRQFEMMRTQYRFVRRRRYGDDIDFDALVEAVGDRAAGLVPSERLFVRLLRNERDIAVMFLVDMSNSTEGWVGKAIKESLVLLGDVMEVVGDRYGIYGFSGMRRSRCELYSIKLIDEPYSEVVRQRICAISPKEYTRMAPPLRHMASKLRDIDARVRLIITISDGKPEDYDDYNGNYAIEDTRQALIEARGVGVIPFCITVDREPHDYLPHMYGDGNYMYVDSVEKLPQRMADMYRLLTS